MVRSPETLTLLGGAAEADFEALADRVFAERMAADVYPEARALVRAHQRKGHTLAIVSSATRYQAEPLARDLGIPHVLCTRLRGRERPLHRQAREAHVLRRG